MAPAGGETGWLVRVAGARDVGGTDADCADVVGGGANVVTTGVGVLCAAETERAARAGAVPVEDGTCGPIGPGGPYICGVSLTAEPDGVTSPPAERCSREQAPRVNAQAPTTPA